MSKESESLRTLRAPSLLEIVECRLFRRPLPALAGMYRRLRPGRRRNPTAPRTRGDVPTVPDQADIVYDRSPHSRGCTATWLLARRDLGPLPHSRGCTAPAAAAHAHRRPLPALAGMYRTWRMLVRGVPSAPRTRGDVPGSRMSRPMGMIRSPHSRGCTEGLRAEVFGRVPLPALAGMYRSYVWRQATVRPAPRTRGDVLRSWIWEGFTRVRSPRSRECTGAALAEVGEVGPLPALAGMYRSRPGTTSAKPGSVARVWGVRRSCSGSSTIPYATPTGSTPPPSTSRTRHPLSRRLTASDNPAGALAGSSTTTFWPSSTSSAKAAGPGKSHTPLTRPIPQR